MVSVRRMIVLQVKLYAYKVIIKQKHVNQLRKMIAIIAELVIINAQIMVCKMLHQILVKTVNANIHVKQDM